MSNAKHERVYEARVIRDPDVKWWVRVYRDGLYMTGFSGDTREEALDRARRWVEADRAAHVETPEPEVVQL